MNSINIALIAIALLAPAQARDLTAESDWKSQKSEAGIDVYTRNAAGSDFKEFKGIMRVRGVRLSSLLYAFDDTSSYTRWMHTCIEAELLHKISVFERFSYIVLDAPWPVTDRDSVVHAFVSQDAKSLTVTITMTARPDYIPPRKNRVRIPRMNTRWTFQPVESGEVVITYQTESRPGGILPAGLANLAVVDIPFYTLQNLRKIVKEEKYANYVYPEIKEPAVK